jgi:lipopolysaccharide/colanic/teichoic acid biosynthesis glycosyltransferase
VLLAPATLLVIGLLALTIRVSMGRPILIFQKRIGLNGRVFNIVKLRSTTIDHSLQISRIHQNDLPTSLLRKCLRCSNLDELPQLWNVLIGDMSFIGPRPAQCDNAAFYRELIPNYDLRHLVRPGLSGYGEMLYGYATNVAEARSELDHDLCYVEHLGPGLDLEVLFGTLSTGFGRRVN